MIGFGPTAMSENVGTGFWSYGRVECIVIGFTSFSGIPKNFFRWGVQQIQLRTEGRENGDLEALAP
jgi:hypothetical protein